MNVNMIFMFVVQRSKVFMYFRSPVLVGLIVVVCYTTAVRKVALDCVFNLKLYV